MKKFISIALAALTAVSLFGCSQDNAEDVSRISELEAQVGSLEASIAALESEKNGLDSQLSDAKSENETLAEENTQLTDELVKQKGETLALQTELNQGIANMKYVEKALPLSNGSNLVLTYNLNRTDGNYAELLLIGKDGTSYVIYADSAITAFAASPDCTKFAFTNFSIEGSSDAFWYDLETGTTTEIAKDKLLANNGASDFLWLDDRYFLFISRHDYSVFSEGGSIYAYDTKTNEYACLIDVQSMVQITSFEIASYHMWQDDIVFFRAIITDPTYNYTTQESFTVSIEELMEMIQNGKTKTYDGERLF